MTIWWISWRIKKIRSILWNLFFTCIHTTTIFVLSTTSRCLTIRSKNTISFNNGPVSSTSAKISLEKKFQNDVLSYKFYFKIVSRICVSWKFLRIVVYLKISFNILHFWTWIVSQQSIHRHDYSRSTKSTLGTMSICQFLLDCM